MLRCEIVEPYLIRRKFHNLASLSNHCETREMERIFNGHIQDETRIENTVGIELDSIQPDGNGQVKDPFFFQQPGHMGESALETFGVYRIAIPTQVKVLERMQTGQ